MIHFMCPSGHELTAPDEHAGKPGKCPKCQTEFLVPGPEDEEEVEPQAPAAATAQAKRREEMIVFLCPNGHKLNGPARLKGRPGQCPHCGAKFRIPADDDEDETEESAAQQDTAQPVAAAAPRFPDFRLPPSPPVEEETIESVELIEEPEEELPLADAVIEPLDSPAYQAEHPLHQLLCWLCRQRQDGQPILVRLKDGEVLEVDYFAPELSQAAFAVFAVRESNDRHSIITLAWNDIARVDLHRVPTLPKEIFE